MVVFPVGPSGAHQLVNRTEETGAYANRGQADEVKEIFMRDGAVDYWQGEEPPA